MKTIFFFLLLSICFTTVIGQSYQMNFLPLKPRSGEIFDQSLYPSDSFSVRRIDHPLGETIVSVILLHHDYMGPEYYIGDENIFFQIWLEQRKNGELLHSSYFGFEEGENYYQITTKPIHQDYYLFNSQREFTGTLFLIDKSGTWHKMTGCCFCFDPEAQVIYSFVPEECGGCTIGKFNLNTYEMITKKWDGKGIAWSEYTHNIWSNLIFGQDERIEWTVRKE